MDFIKIVQFGTLYINFYDFIIFVTNISKTEYISIQTISCVLLRNHEKPYLASAI